MKLPRIHYGIDQDCTSGKQGMILVNSRRIRLSKSQKDMLGRGDMSCRRGRNRCLDRQHTPRTTHSCKFRPQKSTPWHKVDIDQQHNYSETL
jgi:hypothetical protein